MTRSGWLSTSVVHREATGSALGVPKSLSHLIQTLKWIQVLKAKHCIQHLLTRRKPAPWPGRWHGKGGGHRGHRGDRASQTGLGRPLPKTGQRWNPVPALRNQQGQEDETASRKQVRVQGRTWSPPSSLGCHWGLRSQGRDSRSGWVRGRQGGHWRVSPAVHVLEALEDQLLRKAQVGVGQGAPGGSG